MSQYSKSLIAAIAAVLIAGVQAWQTAVGGQPFRLIDLLPVATATVGAFYTYLVPEVPELARAKTWIASGFGVLTALATVLSGHPADVTVLNLLIAGLSAAVVHAVDNKLPTSALPALAHAAADAATGHADLGEITDALAQLEQSAPQPDLTATAPIPAVPAGPLPTAPTPPAELLPIEAKALAAVTATQEIPVATA